MAAKAGLRRKQFNLIHELFEERNFRLPIRCNGVPWLISLSEPSPGIWAIEGVAGDLSLLILSPPLLLLSGTVVRVFRMSMRGSILSGWVLLCGRTSPWDVSWFTVFVMLSYVVAGMLSSI